MSRMRRPTPEELALWQSAIAGTARLEADRSPPSLPVTPSSAPAESSGTVSRPRRMSALLDPERPVDLDRRSWLRLKRGQVTIEQTLDLHGLTQGEAHRRLGAFLARAQAAGCRCVLVITGKGLGSGGTLRHMVPRWLNEPDNRERVIAYTPAQPRHGGSGALYVLMRRRRD